MQETAAAYQNLLAGGNSSSSNSSNAGAGGGNSSSSVSKDALQQFVNATMQPVGRWVWWVGGC